MRASVFQPAILLLFSASFSLLFAPASAESPRLFDEKKAEGGELKYQGGIPVAVFAGTPDEIGRQHAALLAKPGKAVMAFPKRFADELGIGALWPLMTVAGKALIQNAPDRYQKELAAISAHSDMTADELAVANTLLELRRVGCSTLIVQAEHSATGAPIFGRNFDFPTLGDLQKYSLVMVYRPTGQHAFASIAFPGAIGVFSGMNDAGLAIATLDVYRSADGSPKFAPAGTPLGFVYRRILEECTTVDEAERLLKSEKPTTWMNLAVCDRHGGSVFEITPATIGRREAEDGVLSCTNHFRVKGLAVKQACWRYPLLEAARKEPPLDVEAVHKHLDAVNQGELTLQTMIFEPRDLTLHVAFGDPPTSKLPLVRIELGPLLGAAPAVLAK